VFNFSQMQPSTQLLPQYLNLFSLTGDEKRALMYISQNPDHIHVESTILRSLAFAVATKCSDVHFNGKVVNGKFCVCVNIRTKSGFVRHYFNPELGDPMHFETKLLQLSNNTIGGTQAEIISSRFSLDFPHWWAIEESLKVKDKEPYKIDIRVQFQKTFGGFSIVCRILDQQRTPSLGEMSLSKILESEIKKVLNEPSGLILVSGPTGSGKTTLLNAMIGELNDGSRSIFTIENPVEFRISGDGPITQVQTHGQVTFAAGLRSALRSDPDVILIGEIRDSETMEVALQAAQTGHLVLATIHASSAAQTISRMLELTLDKDRDAFRVADTLKMVIAQRLINQYERTPCKRTLNKLEVDWMKLNGLHLPKIFHETSSSIKIGVKALIEAISIDHSIKKIICSPIFNTEGVYTAAKNQIQYETLAMCGIRSVESGDTKLAECMIKLESHHQAALEPSLRTEFVASYELSYLQIQNVIDQNMHLSMNHELMRSAIEIQKKELTSISDASVSKLRMLLKEQVDISRVVNTEQGG